MSFRHRDIEIIPLTLQRRPIIVEKLVEYMAFKSYYQKAGPKEDVPAQEIIERIPLELVLEL